MPASAISTNVARASSYSSSGSSRAAARYISSRHCQKSAAPDWVWPRMARWNTCECVFARPGMVRPGSRVAAGSGAVPSVTAVMTPPSTDNCTSLAAVSAPSHA